MNFLKRLLLGIALLMSAQAFAQHLDTVVNMGNYKSYYSYAVKNPLYVTYNYLREVARVTGHIFILIPAA